MKPLHKKKYTHRQSNSDSNKKRKPQKKLSCGIFFSLLFSTVLLIIRHTHRHFLAERQISPVISGKFFLALLAGCSKKCLIFFASMTESLISTNTFNRLFHLIFFQ